jgi:hypothetical protein
MPGHFGVEAALIVLNVLITERVAARCFQRKKLLTSSQTGPHKVCSEHPDSYFLHSEEIGNPRTDERRTIQ